MSPEAAAALIEYYLSGDDQKKVRDALVKAGIPGKSLKSVITAVIKKAASKFAGKTGEILADEGVSLVCSLVEANIDSIIKHVQNLLSKSDKVEGERTV